MAFAHSKQSRVLLDGLHLSGYVTSVEPTAEVELADVTTLLDQGRKNIPGLEMGTVSLSGNFDDSSAAGGQDAVLATARGASSAGVITVGREGLAIGNQVVMFEARESNYSAASPVGDKVTWSASWDSEGRIDGGVSLHDLSEETADGSASSVDNGASTSNGGVATLHVTAFSGFSAVDVAVQDSADDTAWADLLTFATVAGTTAERVAVTGQVRQFVRAEWDVTDTGSVTFAVGFARR